MFTSSSNGSSWISLAITPGSTNLFINSLAVSGDKLFAGTSVGLFFSTDGGANWLASNTGIAKSTVRSFVYRGSQLFAGTSGNGVFQSTDNGANWRAINTGLSNSDVWPLLISNDNLFAGTFGGGGFPLIMALTGER